MLIKRSFPDWLITIVIFLISVFLQVIAMNGFLIPNNIFSGGFSGIAQVLHYFGLQVAHIDIQTGMWLLFFNIITGVIGWKMIGSQFVSISFLNSVVVSLLLIILPKQAIVNDHLLASLFGGIIFGASIGIAMRFGFSTGGMDIVTIIFQKRTGKSVGFISNIINGLIVLIAGFFINWESALFTMVSMYAMSQVIDSIYTGYRKLTAIIVTQKSDEVAEALKQELIRGVTILPSKGGYSGQTNATIMTVISRAELFDLRSIVTIVDPKAFINIVNTIDVSGLFFTDDQQSTYRKTKVIGNEKISVQKK